MKEKQKTCITIQKAGIISSPFNEYISIPHNVDIIICKAIGFIVIDGTPALVNDAFYITSNLISNIHDQILGFGPNLNYDFPTSYKRFQNIQKIINGNYSFSIHSITTGNVNINNASVVIDLEFIELE